MAIKRFDDIDKKARELEAQAKKLRREKQAAKTKAYADALVAVFPEVKEMGSAGSHTEHEVVADTPQLDRMLMELNRIGVNINQIARAFNARVKGMGMLEEIKMKPDKKAFESLRESIEGLSDEVKELRADLHGGITGGDV